MRFESSKTTTLNDWLMKTIKLLSAIILFSATMSSCYTEVLVEDPIIKASLVLDKPAELISIVVSPAELEVF